MDRRRSTCPNAKLLFHSSTPQCYSTGYIVMLVEITNELVEKILFQSGEFLYLSKNLFNLNRCRMDVVR